MNFTLDQKLKAIQRELAMRRRSYPRWIAEGSMKEADAKFQIAVFEAIESDYQAQITEIEPKLKL